MRYMPALSKKLGANITSKQLKNQWVARSFLIASVVTNASYARYMTTDRSPLKSHIASAYC